MPGRTARSGTSGNDILDDPSSTRIMWSHARASSYPPPAHTPSTKHIKNWDDSLKEFSKKFLVSFVNLSISWRINLLLLLWLITTWEPYPPFLDEVTSVNLPKEESLLTGKLEPTGTIIDVKVPIGGVIKKIHVKEGAFVDENQLLLELDTTAAKSKLEALKAVRSQVSADVMLSKIQLGNDVEIDSITDNQKLKLNTLQKRPRRKKRARRKRWLLKSLMTS